MSIWRDGVAVISRADLMVKQVWEGRIEIQVGRVNWRYILGIQVDLSVGSKSVDFKRKVWAIDISGEP